MDIRTITLGLAVGYLAFAATFYLYGLGDRSAGPYPYWSLGRALQGIGAALIFFRASLPDLVSISIANFCLLAGFAYESWAVHAFCGKPVGRSMRIASLAASAALAALMLAGTPGRRVFLASILLACLYGLTARVLLRSPETRSPLGRYLAAAYSALFLLFALRSAWALVASADIAVFSPGAVQVVVFSTLFVAMLSTGFGSLLFMKQRGDARLRESEARYRTLFQESPDAHLIYENGQISACNRAAEELFGAGASKLLGLRPEAFCPEAEAESRIEGRAEPGFEAGHSNGPRRFERPCDRPDGSRFDAEISSTPMTLEGRRVTFSTWRDVSERSAADARIRELLEEKELMLREVHHRIKNNMATIDSLLTLQAQTLEDEAAAAALRDSGSRIRSMMVLYEKMYLSADFFRLSASDYLSSLVDDVLANFPNAGAVRVEKRLAALTLDSKKLQPLGILVNELLTNAMKYAFPDGRRGTVGIGLSSDGERFTLALEDDGIGLPAPVDFATVESFGLMLVGTLARQLGGEIRSTVDGGTRFMLQAPL